MKLNINHFKKQIEKSNNVDDGFLVWEDEKTLYQGDNKSYLINSIDKSLFKNYHVIKENDYDDHDHYFPYVIHKRYYLVAKFIKWFLSIFKKKKKGQILKQRLDEIRAIKVPQDVSPEVMEMVDDVNIRKEIFLNRKYDEDISEYNLSLLSQEAKEKIIEIIKEDGLIRTYRLERNYDTSHKDLIDLSLILP